MNTTERFSDRVTNYVKYRPSYPAAAIDCVMNTLALAPGSVVADLGSGTGISSKLLLERGCAVYGVEPNEAMRAAAETQLASYPNFHSINGTAEATTLADDSVDAALAAQAFHWFDVPRVRAELFRILKPPYRVTLWWNDRLTDATPFLCAFEDLLVRFGTDYTEVNHRNAQDADESLIAQLFGHRDFGLQSFPNEQRFDYAGLEGRLLSSSYAPLAGHEKYEPMLARLREIFDEHERDGAVSVIYQTRTFSSCLRKIG
jgi:SAM-dependent methyltransferase